MPRRLPLLCRSATSLWLFVPSEKLQKRIAAQSGSTISVTKKKKHAASGPLPGLRPASQPNGGTVNEELRVNTAASLPELRASGPYTDYDEYSDDAASEEEEEHSPQVPTLPKMQQRRRRRL